MTNENDRKQGISVTKVVAKPALADGIPADGAGVIPETDDGAGAKAPGRLRAFMLAKNPDRSYADNDEFENDVVDWAEDADKQLAGYKMSDETIRRVAEDHPEIMDIADDLAKDPKMPLTVAIIRNIDVDEFYPQEGDPDYNAMYKAREERVTRRQKAQEYQAQLDKNLAESRDIVLNWFGENDMSEKEAGLLATFIDGIMGNYLDGRITPRELEMFRNAMNHDSDVADAREVGKVEGMNTNIDAVRQRKQAATDGLPKPGTSAGTLPPPAPTQEPDMIDEIIGVTSKRRNWMDSK